MRGWLFRSRVGTGEIVDYYSKILSATLDKMPFAIIEKDGSEAIAVGATEAEAWENAGLTPQERLKYLAVTITEESYQKALADPTPEEQLGD